jgi:putative endonuclease
MPYYVYILASRSRTLYTGVTNNIRRRVAEHLQGEVPGFTRKYRIHRLVHFEPYRNIRDAITREKQIKSWRREKKVGLIEAQNRTWDDLATGWFPSAESQKAGPSPAPLARDDIS